jgi:branched-chain amino acid transport system permease protein
MSEAVQQVVNWLSLGGIYALLALGVAVVFSILGLINFAHGELVTIAGYSMMGLFSAGLPWPLVFVGGIISAGLGAVLMERIAFRPVRGAPQVTVLLTSLALSLIIQNVLLLFVGARPKSVGLPSWTSSSFHVGDIVLQWIDVVTLVVTALVLVALTLYLRRSIRGIALRAAAEDFAVTRLMGIPAQRVVIGAFAVSGLLAGVAAIFFLSQTALVGPTTGFSPLLKGFIAAVIGGLGSLSGAVVGGYLLAGLEILFQATLPAALLPTADAVVFGIVVLILLVRPHGILGDPTAAAERA